MAYRDIEARRRNDLARYHRRTAERRAAGLCLRCGKTEPAPERTLCEPCAEKCRAADRARSARLRAEGKPVRDPEQAKRHERERGRRQHAERKAAGICTKCGRAPARPDRTTCEPCAERHRARDRARHARAKAEGIPYGGRDPEARRRAGRKSSRRRSEARLAAGLCIRCGAVPPEEGRSMCEPCRDDRRDAARVRHHDRRDAGLCVNCGTPAPDGKAYCRPCAVTKEGRRDLKAKREADRRRYSGRRTRGDCTTCGKPADGGRRVRGLPRCRPRALQRPESRRGMRQVPNAHLRRRGLLRALRPGQGRAARPRGRAGRPATALCRPEGEGPMRRLRDAVAGGGALRALFPQAPRGLGGIPRHSDLGPELDGDRNRHRPGARPL